MPIWPSLFERSLIRAAGAPVPIIDALSGLGAHALASAIRLGVFDGLKSGPMTASELASGLGTDADALERLLAVLESQGYVKRSGSVYRNSRWAGSALTDGPGSVKGGVLYFEEVSRLMADLDSSTRTGTPRIHLYEMMAEDEELAEAFNRWMREIALSIGPSIIKAVSLRSDARILDLGGGHAWYSIELCRKYPGLGADVFDLPASNDFGRSQVEALGLGDRVGFIDGDFLHDDLGSKYDAALAFNILHGLSPEQNLRLLGRIGSALADGGRLVVVEQFKGGPPMKIPRASNAMLDLLFFHLLGGRIYGYQELVGWLGTSGFGSIVKRRILKAPGTSIVQATKL